MKLADAASKGTQTTLLAGHVAFEEVGLSSPTDIHTVISTAAAPSHITAHDWVAWS